MSDLFQALGDYWTRVMQVFKPWINTLHNIFSCLPYKQLNKQARSLFFALNNHPYLFYTHILSDIECCLYRQKVLSTFSKKPISSIDRVHLPENGLERLIYVSVSCSILYISICPGFYLVCSLEFNWAWRRSKMRIWAVYTQNWMLWHWNGS